MFKLLSECSRDAEGIYIMEKNAKLKKIFKYAWVIYALFSIFIVLYLVDRLVCKDIMKVSNRLILNDNWDVTINDDYYENVSLDSFSFNTVNKNDVVVLETIAPTDYQYKEAVLCLKVRHVVLSMYVDGKLEYEYGQERYNESKATGSGDLLINFPSEYRGKKLTLEYVVTEDDAFSSFDKIWLSEWENSFKYVITNNRLPLLMGCFLLVFGVMMTFVQIFAMAISTKYNNVFLLAIFSICIGLWTLCYYDVMLIFAIPVYKISLIEHMALFIAPIPILGYMYDYVKELNSKLVMYIHKILLSVQGGLTILAIMLHMLNLVHGPQMIKYFQILIIVHLLFLCYIIYLTKKNSDRLSKVTAIGLILVGLCVFYELATYFCMRYMKFNIFQIKGVSSVGLTIFIGILVVDLYQRVTKNMMEEQEKALLIRRAYTDDLTKLYNRAFCSEHMRKLSIVKKCDYTIINFDLNGLKQMNDTYGHMKGDELICYAAIVLEQTFSNEGVVGRMGGDEFIVIIENADTEYIDNLLVKFEENIKKVNVQKPDLRLSISYGYATSTEVSGESSEKVYHIADERMYAYKQKVKKEMAQG